MLSGMDYVYAVWKSRSFSAAARRLFISQPALSAAVKKAEKELGLPIFDRSHTPLQLTDAGRAYIEAAARIFHIRHDLQRYCDDLAGCGSGTLSLGGTNFFASCFLPPMIEAFSKKYPQIRLSVTESDSADLYHKLSAGELDIIVDSGIYDSSLYDIMPFLCGSSAIGCSGGFCGQCTLSRGAAPACGRAGRTPSGGGGSGCAFVRLCADGFSAAGARQ